MYPTGSTVKIVRVYRAPSYHAWLDKTGYDEAYRFLARFLRHLQGPAAARGAGS